MDTFRAKTKYLGKKLFLFWKIISLKVAKNHPKESASSWHFSFFVFLVPEKAWFSSWQNKKLPTLRLFLHLLIILVFQTRPSWYPDQGPSTKSLLPNLPQNYDLKSLERFPDGRWLLSWKENGLYGSSELVRSAEHSPLLLPVQVRTPRVIGLLGT